MRTVCIRQVEGDMSVYLTVGPRNAKPGFNPKKTSLFIRVTNVPDDVTDAQVLALYNQTAVYHALDSTYVIDFSRLQPGAIVVKETIGHYVNSSTAAEMLGITRQSVYAFHKASRKPDYRGKFPRAVYEDPDGGNPWFKREDIERYAKYRHLYNSRGKSKKEK